MKNSTCLYAFYAQLCQYHMSHFPNLRFGQLMANFFAWIKTEKNCDPYYASEDDMIAYLAEYAQGSEG